MRKLFIYINSAKIISIFFNWWYYNPEIIKKIYIEIHGNTYYYNPETLNYNELLLHACIFRKFELIAILINKYYAYTGQKDYGESLLHRLYRIDNKYQCDHYCSNINNNDNINIINILLKSGLNINEIDKDGKTSLILACNLNPYNFTICNHVLILDELVKNIKYLIDNGANVNHQDYNGKTAIMYSNYKQISELLIKNGANINIQDNKGYTPIIYSNIPTIQCLIDNGADLTSKYNKGKNILMIIIDQKYFYIDQLVHILLNNHIYIDDCDDEGKTALYYACLKYDSCNINSMRLINLLLGFQADPDFLIGDKKLYEYFYNNNFLYNLLVENVNRNMLK